MNKGKDMEQKLFTKNDNGFICANCGFEVKPLGYTSRNHCPKCLCSLHVDVNPGDRACECHGIMRPVRDTSSSTVAPNAARFTATRRHTRQRSSQTI